MEYEFIHDPTNGNAKAKFSLEHEVFGPWLEIEVGQSLPKIKELLKVINDAEANFSQNATITGLEYSVVITNHDVTVKANVCMNGEEALPEALMQDSLHLDSQAEGSCGIEDFRDLLLSWSTFNKY